MRLPRSTFLSALALAAAWICFPRDAHAQACCAGASVITPARLEVHEKALVGVQLRGGAVIGSYDTGGNYRSPSQGASEFDFEQDLLGAVRFSSRGQVALQVPFVETYRHGTAVGSNGAAGSIGAAGGGIGDVNAAVRYDFLLAGEARYVPGVALLAGVTAPSGRPPESSRAPLNVDSTGIGAWQVNLALALEELEGPWLVNFTAIAAKRTPRGGETLGTQITLLLAGAYTFKNDIAVALALSYAFEGPAARGAYFPEASSDHVPFSSKRLTTITASALWPIGDEWRILGSVYLDPPISALSSNQPALTGTTVTVIRSWM
jgi:hypothetical protein